MKTIYYSLTIQIGLVSLCLFKHVSHENNSARVNQFRFKYNHVTELSLLILIIEL